MAMIQGNHFVKYVPVPEIQRREHGKSHLRPVQDFMRFLNIMARLVIVFSPQRFFLPPSFATILAGALTAARQDCRPLALLRLGLERYREIERALGSGLAVEG